MRRLRIAGLAAVHAAGGACSVTGRESGCRSGAHVQCAFQCAARSAFGIQGPFASAAGYADGLHHPSLAAQQVEIHTSRVGLLRRER